MNITKVSNGFVNADTTTNESINLKDDVLCFNDVSLSFQPDHAVDANTVKTLLIKAGVQEESIRCYPLGYDLNPFKCDCFDSSGEWDEDNAKKNRVVYITDASSAVANVFYQNLD